MKYQMRDKWTKIMVTGISVKMLYLKAVCKGIGLPGTHRICYRLTITGGRIPIQEGIEMRVTGVVGAMTMTTMVVIEGPVIMEDLVMVTTRGVPTGETEGIGMITETVEMIGVAITEVGLISESGKGGTDVGLP